MALWNAGWQKELLSLVNAARAANGAALLCLNSKLNAAAQAHSNDQAAMNRMSHTGSNGSAFNERITAAGYSGVATAENVAMGQRTVQEVFNDWMNSPGHRANILGKSYNHMGAGLSNFFWSQEFGSSTKESCMK
jgi:uncharacterized protein YkwD